ncbi:MAG: 50S ribosomal protein L21 [Candidatus Shikimatogenerans sp. AspAUS03]|uniref:50S ribosomal protein L21 n=1 Tax=Candidatus Shikimatogenerans sp. AspAUS03 TaxID=3158563 RepID=A0AAU7QSZ5_9FLAO
MQCIISIIKGFQYIIYLNKYIYLPFLKGYKINDLFYIKDNLFYKNKKKFILGTPYIKKLLVISKIIKHLKGNKKIIYKKKRRKGYSKKIGYKNLLTKIKIISIN